MELFEAEPGSTSSRPLQGQRPAVTDHRQPGDVPAAAWRNPGAGGSAIDGLTASTHLVRALRAGRHAARIIAKLGTDINAVLKQPDVRETRRGGLAATGHTGGLAALPQRTSTLGR
jgi:hypothetical protein